jgi:uncharacterized membrane protein YkoI
MILGVFQIAVAVLTMTASSTAWALFESNKTLADKAQVTMQQALATAEKQVPGKPVKVEMGKDEGRVVYEIQIVDGNNKTTTVYVDAVNGRILEMKK